MKEVPAFKVSSHYVATDLTYYDPIKNRAMHQMLITETLYDRLIEKDIDGVIQPAIAESYRIIDNEIIFKIREGLQTSSGKKIDNEDVAFSLNRLMESNNAFSQGFKDSVSTGSDCEHETSCGIQLLDGNKISIRSKISPDLLLEGLVESPYSIVPRSAYDPEKGEIVDFVNTSGAYYFSHFSDEGYLVLKANPFYYDYHLLMPQEVIFVGKISKEEGNKLSVAQNFIENQIDMIPIAETMSVADIEKLLEFCTKNEFQIHQTYKLMVLTAKFSIQGRKRLSREHRLLLGKLLREAAKEIIPSDLYSHSIYYIVSPGFGSLSSEQEEAYRGELDSITGSHSGHGIVIEVPDYVQHKYVAPILKYLPDAKIVEPQDYTVSSTNRVEENEADIVFTMEFPGISESYSWISWAIGAKIFPLTEEESANWIKKYLNTSSWSERRDMYREVQYKALVEDPTIVPLAHTSKWAFIKPPWKMNLSRFDTSNYLHRIRFAE